MQTVRLTLRSLATEVWRTPRRHRTIAGGCAALVVASLLPIVTIATPGAASTGTTAVPAGYLQQQVAWGTCSWWTPFLENSGYKRPECASVTVPRDWAKPGSGPDLTIAISRVRAGDPAHRQGILFTNPGGPGGNGITMPVALTASQASQHVAADYDVIGMDPRGVAGNGTTPLNCDIPLDQLLGLTAPDSRDMSPAALEVRQKVAKLIADSCAANPLTRYINTWQTTHDMDLIRALLGEQKLNYLGYSYGTWLGAKYAALFPQNTGRMVLDSNTGWMDPLANTFLSQPLGFDRRFRQQWAPWAARQVCSLCAPGAVITLGGTADQVLATYERIRAAGIAKVGSSFGPLLDGLVAGELYSEHARFGFIFAYAFLNLFKSILIDQPATTAASVAQTPVAPALDQVLTMLPDQTRELVTQDFPATFGVDLAGATVGDLLRSSGRGTGGLDSVLAAAQTGADAAGAILSYNDVFDAVRCGDAQQQYSPNWFVNFTRQTGPAYPLEGYTYAADPCSYWSLPTTALPNPDPNKVTIVTVQSELDPPTPYESTNRNIAQFRGARLVSINDGGDHGEFLIAGNSCVDDAVNAYLVDGANLPAQTACTGTPLWKAFREASDNTPVERQVYPVTGPLDGKNSPKSVTATLNAGEHERQLQLALIIGNTEGGQPLGVITP